MSVIKTVHEMNRTRTRSAQTHPELARMLGEAARHEGRRLFVPDPTKAISLFRFRSASMIGLMPSPAQYIRSNTTERAR
jgi:hypothetical protein